MRTVGHKLRIDVWGYTDAVVRKSTIYRTCHYFLYYLPI